jgi:hypothetical protein
MLLPMFLLSGCGAVSCFNNTVQEGGAGTVTFANPPTTVTPGTTVALDITGTNLREHCIYNVSSLLSTDSAWARRWYDPAQDSSLFQPTVACRTFRGTIDVPIPADFTGGELTVRVSSRAQNAALLFTVGTIFTAQDSLTLKAAAPAAPSAPTARVFPHYLRMLSTEDAARTIDARTSTDPQGQTLTYTWDTNNDGVYGDPVEETGTAGLVRIPAATLNAIGTRFTFGVKATNTSGLSATATARAEVITRLWSEVGQTITLAPAAGAAGSPSTVTLDNRAGATLGCVDSNGDDVYTDAELTAANAFTATFTAAAGNQRIAVIAADVANTCTFYSQQIAAGSYGVDQVVATLYTSSAARSSRATTKGYRAKARFTLGKATMVALGTSDGAGTFNGTTGRGTYTLRTPAKGNGSTRPNALTLFPKGDYVVRAASLGFFGATRTQTVIGESTMLLRGTGGALICLGVTGTPRGSTYVFRGGTGAASKLTGSASSTRLQVRAKSAKPPKSGTQSFKGKRQQKPIRSNATIAAATATATPLPADCSALRRHLP